MKMRKHLLWLPAIAIVPIVLIFTLFKSHTITGTFELIDDNIGGQLDNCRGKGGYSDIEAFMPVTIRDQNGNVIGTGKTGLGKKSNYGSSFTLEACTFDFEVKNIKKSDIYVVEIGERGSVTHSFQEMEEVKWNIQLVLGR